jgi:hypothetical protein
LAGLAAVAFQHRRDETQTPSNFMSKHQHRQAHDCEPTSYAAIPLPVHDDRVALR